MAITATYISSTSFSVTGDQTAIFTADRLVKLSCGVDGYVYGTILSSTYTTLTTVVISESVITSNLETALVGMVQSGSTGSLPVHDHGPDFGQGGVVPCHYNNMVTVSSIGGDFTTIQAAIDSITDASASNRYVVRIYPGRYVENVVMKDYVDLMGVSGRKGVEIYGTTGTLLTLPANEAFVDRIYLNLEPTSSDDIALDATAGGGVTGLYRMDNLDIRVYSDLAIKPLAMKVMAAQYLYCRNVEVNFTLTNANITGTFGAIDILEGSDIFYFLRSIARAYIGAGAGANFATVRDTSHGSVVFSITTVESRTTNAAFNGISTPFAAYGSDGSLGYKKQISDSAFNAYGTGGTAGSGYAIYHNTTTNNGLVRAKGNNYTIGDYLNNHRYYIGTGDTVKSVFNQDYTDTTDDIQTNGILKGVDSRWTDGVEIEPQDSITATSDGVAALTYTKITFIATNGDADLDNVTLADGVPGQEKYIVCVSKGNVGDTWKITPANMIGGTQITFTGGIGEGCTLVMHDNGWVVASKNGGTVS